MAHTSGKQLVCTQYVTQRVSCAVSVVPASPRILQWVRWSQPMLLLQPSRGVHWRQR